MAKQNLENGAAFGTQRGKINSNFTELYGSVASLTPLIQVETAEMVSKLSAEGTLVDNGLIIAIDNFYVELKRYGALDLVKWLWIPLGTNLNSAMVNLVAKTGVPLKLVNNGFVSTDYIEEIGFGTGDVANTTKYLDAGFNPADLGLTNSAFAFGHFSPIDAVNTNAFFVGLAPETGTTAFGARSSPTTLLATGNSLSLASTGGVMAIYNQLSATQFQGFKFHVKVADGTSTVTPTAFVGNVNLFRATSAGVKVFARSYSSGAFISAALNENQARSINQAIFDLNVYLGRINVIGGRVIGTGDSNTDGQNVTTPSLKWINILGQKTGLRPYVVALGGARFASNSNEKIAGYVYDNELLNRHANAYVCMWGTNDQRSVDVTTNGDPVVIADFKTKYITLVNRNIAKGRKVMIISPLYNGTTNATKAQLWNQGVSDVARATGAIYVDGYNLLVDTGTPTTYLVADVLHLNNAGSTLLGERATSAFTGKLFRQLPFDFPSINAGASADITIFMGTANVGQTVTLGFSSPPVNNLDIIAFVSSQDTVTVRATNNTASTIDPSSQIITVNLFI